MDGHAGRAHDDVAGGERGGERVAVAAAAPVAATAAAAPASVAAAASGDDPHVGRPQRLADVAVRGGVEGGDDDPCGGQATRKLIGERADLATGAPDADASAVKLREPHGHRPA